MKNSFSLSAFLFAGLLLLSPLLSAQSWQQAIRFGDSEREGPLQMAVDANDNVYVLGFFEGNTIRFDANTTLVRGTSTDQDYFLAKYDASLQFQWAKRFGPGARRFGSGALSFAMGLDLAPNGDPVVALSMTGDTVHVAGTRITFNDVMFEDWVRAGVIRLSAADGSVVWSRFPEQYGANDPINGPYFTSLTVNDQGEIFVGGTVSDVGLTVDTSSFSLPTGTTNNTNVFAFSLNGDGTSRWAVPMYHNDGSNDLNISGFPAKMNVGTDGGVYLGWYDPDGRGDASSTNDGHHLQKLDPANGNRLWSTYLGTLKGGGDRWVGLEPMPDGSVLAMFTFREVVDLGASIATPNAENEPGVLARFAADGTPLAVSQLRSLITGPYNSGTNFLLAPYAMSSVNSQGHFLVAGSFYGDLPLSNGVTLIGEKLNGALPGEDVLVLELDTTLAIKGTLQAGSNNRDRGQGVAWSSSGTALVTGDFLLNPTPIFRGPIAFDNIELTSVGRHDVFISEGTPGITSSIFSGFRPPAGLTWVQQGSLLRLRNERENLENLELLDSHGKVVVHLADALPGGAALSRDIRSLAPGMYVITGRRQGAAVAKKILLHQQ